MTIYQVSAKSPNQRYVRILGVVGITVMLGLWFISAHNPSSFKDSTNRFLGLFGLFVVLVAGAAAAVLSAREGLWKVKRSLRIEVSNEKIMEARDGGATTEIELRSIKDIYEYPRGLIIRATEGSKRVFVPREVVGFEELKQRLSAFSSIQPASTKGTVGLILQLAVLISAFSLLFLVHRRVLILSIGVTILIYYAAIIIYLKRLLKGRPLPRAMALTYTITALVTLWITYMRFMSPH